MGGGTKNRPKRLTTGIWLMDILRWLVVAWVDWGRYDNFESKKSLGYKNLGLKHFRPKKVLCPKKLVQNFLVKEDGVKNGQIIPGQMFLDKCHQECCALLGIIGVTYL